MSKVEDSHSEMAHARQIDGIHVIFDRNSPASSRSPSRSRSNWGKVRSSGSGRYRGRGSHRGRSSSSSSSSRSSSHSRSRSHPRCHRTSSRCGCDSHRRYGRARHRRSPPRRYRACSRSWSSSSQSPSPDRTCRRRSRSRSSGQSVSLSLDDKRELLKAAQTNAITILEVEKLELPESVKPILSEQSESKWASLEPERRVRQDPEKTLSQVGF